MPRSHKPSKVSQTLTQRNERRCYQSGAGHLCPMSPTGSHQWLVDSPSGLTCTGVCRYCAEQRLFPGSFDVARVWRGKR